jgi:phosphoenolpyruvate carboxykinase (ATP)
MTVDPVFGLRVPQACPEVEEALLNPRATWQDKAGYDRMARELAGRFEDNFARFAPFVGDEVQAAGIRAAA